MNTLVSTYIKYPESIHAHVVNWKKRHFGATGSMHYPSNAQIHHSLLPGYSPRLMLRHTHYLSGHG